MIHTTSRLLRTLALGAAALTLTLAGCASSSPTYTDLGREPSEQDTVPAAVDIGGLIDPDTIRFVADDGDWSLWIASDTEASNVCLIIYGSDDLWSTTCGGTGGAVETDMGVPNSGFGVASDGATLPDNWTAISENVYRIGS